MNEPFDDISSELIDVKPFSRPQLEIEKGKFKAPEIDAFEIYKIIVDHRKFEIENFWKRTTFFWGTTGILFAAYFSVKIDTRFLILISLTGFIYNLIFTLSLRGSKYWQVHWEFLAEKYESILNDIRVFRWDLIKEIDLKIKNEWPIHKPRRISVSKLVMILGDFLTFCWAILIVKDLHYLYETNEFSLKYFDFGEKSKLSMLFVGFLSLAIFFFTYIIIFIYKTSHSNGKKRSLYKTENAKDYDGNF